MTADDQAQSGSDDKISGADGQKKQSRQQRQQREIKGNLPYISSPTYIKRVLDAAYSAERPENFSKNWINKVLNIQGGPTGSVPNFLKKVGFVASDGSPTERYSRFKTESGRPQAVFEGLKHAYSELFAKNEVVHKADEAKVIDYIVEITGLIKTDAIVRHIYNCFDSLRQYLPSDFSPQSTADTIGKDLAREHSDDNHKHDGGGARSDQSLGLSYHINVVIPETDNPAVLDAIFKSIKRNLL